MIRVFIGCAPDGADAECQAVLEHSIRTRSSEPVDITWMIATRDPASFWSGWDMSKWATPFSGFRWAVPLACGYRGRAIYMDSDLVVIGDLAELWALELGPHQVVAARDATRFCIALWDCERARQHLMRLDDLRQIDGHARSSAYFRTRPGLVRSFGSTWNYLDTIDHGPLGKIVHFTDLSTQPQLKYAVPRLHLAGQRHWYDGPRRPHPRPDLAQLFDREFNAAIADGYTADRYIPAEQFGQINKRSMGGYRAR